MFTWLKRINWDWLPLSGLVIIIYMIQRGFAAFSKMGVDGLNLNEMLSLYFWVVSLSGILVGLIVDRLRAPVLVGLMTVLGGLGLLANNPIIFGVGLGLAATMTKMIPFSIPLKNKDTKIDALRVAPQSSAKNIGAGLFTLIMAGLTAAGFLYFQVAIAWIWMGLGALTMWMVHKHNVKLASWNIKEMLGMLGDWKLWVYAAWYTSCGFSLYYCMRNVIPGFMDMGMTKAVAAGLFASLSLWSSVMRWPAAWLGDKIGHFKTMLIGTALQTTAAISMFYMPLIGIILYFTVFSINTPNMWACAKEWFGEKMGSAMGVTFIIAYIAMGIMFGTWSK